MIKPTGKLKMAYETIAKLEAQNEELRTLLADKLVDSTKLHDFVARDGRFTLGFEGGVAQLLAQALAKQLYESKAENYIEASFEVPMYAELGHIVVTIKRETGKTPHQLRIAAEQELAALKQKP